MLFVESDPERLVERLVGHALPVVERVLEPSQT